MRFVLEVELGNETMRTGEDVAAALRKVAGMVEFYGEDFSARERSSGPIKDLNGNAVGSWKVKVMKSRR